MGGWPPARAQRWAANHSGWPPIQESAVAPVALPLALGCRGRRRRRQRFDDGVGHRGRQRAVVLPLRGLVAQVGGGAASVEAVEHREDLVAVTAELVRMGGRPLGEGGDVVRWGSDGRGGGRGRGLNSRSGGGTGGDGGPGRG